jgi:hypothetical protein
VSQHGSSVSDSATRNVLGAPVAKRVLKRRERRVFAEFASNIPCRCGKLRNAGTRSLKVGEYLQQLSVATATHAKEGLMLATRHHTPRNPLFQFHPLHTLFSLVGTLILFGLLVWFSAVPAK